MTVQQDHVKSNMTDAEAWSIIKENIYIHFSQFDTEFPERVSVAIDRLEDLVRKTKPLVY